MFGLVPIVMGENYLFYDRVPDGLEKGGGGVEVGLVSFWSIWGVNLSVPSDWILMHRERSLDKSEI